MLFAVALAASIYTVRSGDTLSGISASTGASLSSLESQVSNPDLIYPGQQLDLGGGAAPAAQDPGAPPPAVAPVQQAAPASSGGFSIPGMPQSLANCIAYRESTNGTNPAANGNVFGIIPASGYNVAGDSVAQQEQVAGQLYAQYGGSPWAADGCPGTLPNRYLRGIPLSPGPLVACCSMGEGLGKRPGGCKPAGPLPLCRHPYRVPWKRASPGGLSSSGCPGARS